MEEVLVVVLQLLVEFFVEVLIYTGIDLGWRRDDSRVGCSSLSLFLLFGGALGGLANVIYPRLLLPSEGLRVAALLAGPLAAGGLSWLVARWRKERGAAVVPDQHFATAFAFVLAFDVVRYAFGTH
jgi:hypothetical protein